MQKSFPATLNNLKNVRLFLTSLLKNHNIDDVIINQIELGVDEAASNIIKHSYKGENKDKEINIKLEISKKKISIHLFDNGDPADPKKIKPRDLKEIKTGGLGTHFIQEVMDEVKWKNKSKGWANHLTLVKYL
jgi:anti-sigma regulatory factor (Ser/Thr protein kinase)